MTSSEAAENSPSALSAPISRGGTLQLRDLPGWVPFALIFIFGLFAYGLSLNSDFYMDDYPFVLEQETVRGGEWDPHGRGFRHVPFLLWRGIYGFAGASAPAFHALNIVLHLASAFALFALGGALFRRLGLDAIPARRAALVGALVFVVHPFASEAVNYVRCAEILSVTLFTLLSAWFMLRLLEKPNAGDSILFASCALLAIFSKDPGLFHLATTLGLIALAIWKRGAITEGVRIAYAKSKPATLAVAAAGLVIGAFLAKQWVHIITYKFARTEFGYIWDHTLTQGRIFWAYLAKMVAPFDLKSDHLIAWSNSASDLPALLGLCAVVVFLLLTLFAIRVRKTRIVALLLALTAAPIALRFLYPNAELFVEYRAYPALPFFGLLVGLGVSKLYDRVPTVGKWAGLGLVLACVGLSFQRNATWGNAEWLADDVLDKYPLNNRARTQLQHYAYQSGDYTCVFQVRTIVRAQYEALVEANQSLPWGRKYDLRRAQRNLANCEQLTAYGLVEVADTEKALEFCDKVIADFRQNFGPFASEEDFERLAGSLLEVREELLQNGADYDRIRRERGIAAAEAVPASE